MNLGQLHTRACAYIRKLRFYDRQRADQLTDRMNEVLGDYFIERLREDEIRPMLAGLATGESIHIDTSYIDRKQDIPSALNKSDRLR
jgi:hypothetical protein